MEEEKVDVVETSAEEKKEEKEEKESFFDKVKRGCKKVGDEAKKAGRYVIDNREKIVKTTTEIVGTVVVITGAVTTVKKAFGGNKTAYERTVDQRKTQYYDPSSRRYYELRREPRYDELIEIDERRAAGEPVSLILSDMGLLRRKGW